MEDRSVRTELPTALSCAASPVSEASDQATKQTNGTWVQGHADPLQYCGWGSRHLLDCGKGGMTGILPLEPARRVRGRAVVQDQPEHGQVSLLCVHPPDWIRGTMDR